MAAGGASPVAASAPVAAVDRFGRGELSFERFYRDYALARRPCVITGGADRIGGRWGLVDLTAAAGGRPALLKRKVADSAEWARLESAADGAAGATVAEYIAALGADAVAGGGGVADGGVAAAAVAQDSSGLAGHYLFGALPRPPNQHGILGALYELV